MGKSPLSSAIVVGNLIFTSGQVGRHPSSGSVPEQFEAQVQVALENLGSVLAAAGGSLDSVVKTTVFLTDAGDFQAMNSVYARYLEAPFPARSTVVVAALAAPELKFEIEAVAVRTT
jgi:2-iminobutanoate/2-iminopropanoate deaminase